MAHFAAAARVKWRSIGGPVAAYRAAHVHPCSTGPSLPQLRTPLRMHSLPSTRVSRRAQYRRRASKRRCRRASPA
eukprot:scaffold14805_cov121-Isochrysis_galbana.AAC.2